MKQESKKRPRLHAYSPNRRPELWNVYLDPHWNLTRTIDYKQDNRGTTVAELIESAIIKQSKLHRLSNRGFNRQVRSYKIPTDGICPKCSHLVGRHHTKWYLQNATPVCRVCHNANKRQLKPRNRTRSQQAAIERLHKTLGNPPLCWCCETEKPTEGNKPGRKWIVTEGYLPTCRACYAAGAKIIQNELFSDLTLADVIP